MATQLGLLLRKDAESSKEAETKLGKVRKSKVTAEAATAVWFCEACWAALDIAQFAETMREAAQRQRRALDRKRAFRLLRRGAK